jgi:hypothetical protein
MFKYGVLAVLMVCFCGVSYAQSNTAIYREQGGAQLTVASGGTLLIDEGTINTSGTTLLTAQTVTLTTGTTTIPVLGKTLVTLNSNANLTGVTLTSGTVGQYVVIVTGSGSNTVRFDDSGTTMALGGNITLTEGQSDAIGLLCTAARQWALIFDRSGN